MYTFQRAVRCLSVLALPGAMAACNGPESGTQLDWPGDCFIVYEFTTEPPPAPHTEINDEFCIERDGDDWRFVPGEGMENWQSISGGSEIPMQLTVKNPSNIQWTMNVDVTDHNPQNPSNGGHGRRHENGWGFRIRVNGYSDPDETKVHITGAGGQSGIVHGGSAHANLN